MNQKRLEPITGRAPHESNGARRDERGLGPVAYALLGSLAIKGPQTPYQLKRVTGEAIGYFCAFSHAQIYSESARLVELELVSEEREEASRRRRTLSITDAGTQVLRSWLDEHTETGREVRDVGMMKLFFSEVTDADTTRRLIAQQLAVHRGWHRYYVDTKEHHGDRTDLGNRLVTADMAILFEEAAIEFWNTLVVDDDGRVRRTR